MAHRKLDMGKAWTQATGMIGANRDLVGVLAGIFLFLPLFVVIYLLLTSGLDFGADGREPDPERVAAQINAFMLANWWALLLAIVGQLCGGIAILALLGDPARPTVREALGAVPRLFLPMLGGQLLVGLLTQFPSFLTSALPAAAEAAASLIVLPATFYLSVKFALVSAVIVIGGRGNPVTAMRESWQLTKSNSFRLFLFFVSLVLLGMVIGLILLLVVGLVFSALGERVALIGNTAFLAMLLTVFYTISYALTAAIHRQLSQSIPDEEPDLFE